MEKLTWTTVQKCVNDLIPQEINPRTISDKQMSDLKRSLRKYNLVEIPVVDTDNKILAGHQRILALKVLGRGEEKIDVRVQVVHSPRKSLNNTSLPAINLVAIGIMIFSSTLISIFSRMQDLMIWSLCHFGTKTMTLWMMILTQKKRSKKFTPPPQNVVTS